jgi:hypothetical protein
MRRFFYGDSHEYFLGDMDSGEHHVLACVCSKRKGTDWNAFYGCFWFFDDNGGSANAGLQNALITGVTMESHSLKPNEAC